MNILKKLRDYWGNSKKGRKDCIQKPNIIYADKEASPTFVGAKDLKVKSQIHNNHTDEKKQNHMDMKSTSKDGVRLNKVLTELNIGLLTAIDYLKSKGYNSHDLNVNSRISIEQYNLLQNKFKEDAFVKEKSRALFANSNSDEKKSEQKSSDMKSKPKDGIRFNKVLRELNIGLETAIDYLKSIGYDSQQLNINSKISNKQYDILQNRFKKDRVIKNQSQLQFGNSNTNVEITERVNYTPIQSSLNNSNKDDNIPDCNKPPHINVIKSILVRNYDFLKLFFEQPYVPDTNVCIETPLLMHDIRYLHQVTNYLLAKVQMQEIKSPQFIISRTVLEELDRKKIEKKLKWKVKKFNDVTEDIDIIYPPLDVKKKIPKEWSLKNADNRILNSAVDYSGKLVTNDKLLQKRARSIGIDVYNSNELECIIHEVKRILQSAKKTI